MKPTPPAAKRSSRLPREFDFYALEDRVLLNGDSLDHGEGVEAAPDADWVIDDFGGAAPVPDARWSAILDTAAAEDLLQGAAEHPPLVASDDGTASATTRTELIFVDGAVNDSATLIAGLRQEGGDAIHWIVVEIDERADGVQQITETLRGLRDLDAVHILSHGDSQGIQLGNARLDIHTASGYAGDIARWANALDADADLLIYGCDLASSADGQELLHSIASLTNADVAASDDLTGHASYGADWQLEYQLGSIDTGVAFTNQAQEQWDGALATFVVTNTSNSGAGSLRQAILDANAAVGSDTITFNIAGSGVQTINLTSALAKIQDTVTIDGYTQTGASANTLSTGDNAVLMIELNGAAAGGSHGLELDNGSNGSVIKGLIINRFGRSGIQINSESNLIVGNFIGTDSTGATDLGNVIDGITISGHNNTIGGSAAASRNIVSGNNDEGIDIDPGFTGNLIIGNYIGTDASGTAGIGNGSGGSSGGVVIDGSSNRVGGTAAGEGNVIGYNSGFGVFQTGAGAVDNAILGNSIYGNSDLGLDLKGDGLSSNDLGDGDSGSGNLQNFPVLSSAVTTGAQINLGGSLNSTANSYFRLEFFSNTTQDAIGHGEGQTYLGFANVTTDASGNATFNTSLTASVATGSYISGTATKTNAAFTTFTDTSEFAANIIATNTAPTLDAAKSPVLGAISEDSGVPTGAVGTLVSALIDSASPAGQVDNVSDPDAGAQFGIAVTGANSANGTWYFTTDNGVTWSALGAVSNANSRLLASDANTRLYFKPSADYNGTIADAITFRAWDRTSGTNGGTAHTGGLTGTLLDTFSVTSYSNNDGTINWSSSWIENDKDGNGATAGRYYVANSTLYFTGSEVGRWIYREADLSLASTATFSFNLISNALGGSEEVNVQVSGDGGASFTTLAIISPGTAPGVRTFDISAYAASNTQIRIYDNGGGGKIVQFDDVQITVGGNGGTTAFSTATDTASLVVNPINDAPVLDNTGTPTLNSITEDQLNNSGQTVAAIVASAGGDRITDVDSGASEGIAISSLTSGNGTWQFSTDAGGTWSDIGTVSNTSALLLRSTDLVRFVPDGSNGTSADFSFRAWDQTSGTAGTKVSLASNGGETAFSTAIESATIVVTDVNDAPLITSNGGGATASISIAENQTAVTTVTSSDVDLPAQTISYSITGGADAAKFAINSTTGAVSFVSGRDRENPTDADGDGVYEVDVQASDGSLTDVQSLQVTITDVNEFAVSSPSDGDVGANSADENAANGTAVGLTASATDADATNNTVTFAMVDDAGGRFAVDATTGVVTVANGSLLDRESAASHTVTIRATSSDGSTADSSFTININDVDEFDVGAVTDSDAAANAVNENAANGTAVGVTALASDADATTNGITYTLDNDAGGRFAINATTGVVTVADGTLLDRESASSHIITVRATSSDASFSTQAMTITVNDVDEFDVGAVTDSDAAANAVNENAANGTVVGVTALASDADATTNSITYTLDDDAGGRFTIDATTGVVTVADGTLLDRESASSHNITIRATSSDASFSTQAMTINVNDVDEFNVGAVTDSDATANAVDENAGNGTAVGVTALASDADATTNGITYTLDDDAGGRFAIDATTGVVTVADGMLLDRETASSHNITIRATSSDASFSTQAMTINVNDVDEFDVGAVTDSDAAANAVNENAANGTVVGVTALASDADATTNSITYTLDDDAGGRFAIDATTGVVTVADGTLLDRESASSHNITIRATSGDASFGTQAMTINVSDVDEFDVGAVTDSDAAANAVNENAVNGTVVGVTALASDADATTNGITYTLDDDAGGRFSINATTGVVAVADGTLLDRESASSHNITIRATSSDASFSTQAMTINVNDDDEFDVGAVTDSDAAANAVNENAVNGTVVGVTALASDADATTNGITYTLDDDAGGRFSINATTGVVAVADGTLLDRESASSHNITIRATSSDASFSTQAMTINVNDVDEFNVGPVTDSDAAANAVNENAANGTMVGVTALASDADATTNSITYTLDDDAGGRFAINATTGVVTVADGTLLDRESASSHNITIRATSSDASFSTQAMTINVNDVDEFNVGPVTDSDAAANAVNENAANGTMVGVTALASDADATTNSITYTLDDDAGGRFAINATTGVVTVADGTLLDRESASSHNITIRATSSDASFSTQAMTINVNDVDEFTVGPVTDSDAAANAVNENAANGTMVGVTALASDADATTNSITYTLDDDASGRFAINATTGVVTVADGTLLDREGASSHNITIRATSSDASFSTQAMTINVNDVDEFDVGPVSDSDAAANAVNENAANGTVVGMTALASDADATTNSITYTLDDNAGGRFAINATTGVVTVADGTLLDRETASSHNITIRATSSDASFSTQAMTITVNDVDEFDVGAVSDTDAAANAVNENAANGTVVGVTALASDADATTSGITYTLADNDGGRFAIDATTGVVTVAVAINRETDGPVRNINIQATSADGSVVYRNIVIQVNDLDESDVGAVNDGDAAANQVDENATIGTSVGVTATASDADATASVITYSLIDDDGGRFAIDSTTGVVTVAGAIDREADGPVRTVTVRATSADGSTSEQNFAISINDLDEFDVGVVSDSDAAINGVDENAAVGTVVGVAASASDADATTSGISYSLADDDGGRFAIDATTGVVTVAGALDYESDGSSRSITILASSADGSSRSTTVSIDLYDVNDNAPVIVNNNLTISEGQRVTLGLSELDATDADSTNLSFVVLNAVGGHFERDGFPGQPVTLFTRAEIASGSIDFVHDGSETVPGYSLTVSDSQFTSGAVQASIAWTPVNDATTIAGSPAQITYVENAAPLWIAPAALLADSDSAQLSTLTVEIVGYRPSEDSLVLTGTTSLVALWEVSSGKFTLSGSGSVAQYQSALRELAYVNSSENPSAGARWVQVVVDDGQTDSLVTSIALNVLPVNDAPLASGESYSMLTGGALQIAEPGLLANDVDLEGDALTTLLVLPPARGRVTITANGGMVYTPNAGFFGQDVIRYQVSDGSASSSIVEIQIQVEAVNSGNSSQPPAGPAPTQTTGVPEPAASEDGEAKDRDAARADAPSGEQSDAPGGGPVAGRGQSGGSAAGVSSAGQPLEVVSGSTGIFDPDAILAESGDRNTMYSRSIARSGLEREGGHERSPSLLRGTSQESDRDPSDLVILDGGISADIEQSIVWSNWDQVQEDAAEEYESDSYMIGVVGTSASVLSVGYTLWVIRGSVLAATMMGSVPGWGMVDPASLLQIYRDRSKEREDDVEKMLYR